MQGGTARLGGGNMKNIVGDMVSFCTLHSAEKTVATQGDSWWPQTARQKWAKICGRFCAMHQGNVMDSQMEIYLSPREDHPVCTVADRV